MLFLDPSVNQPSYWAAEAGSELSHMLKTSCGCIIIIIIIMHLLFGVVCARLSLMRDLAVLKSGRHVAQIAASLFCVNRFILFCNQFSELHFHSAVHFSVGSLAGQTVLGLSWLQN